MSDSLEVYSLLAGDVLLGHEIIQTAREQVESQDIASVPLIAETVRVAYQQKRLERVVKTELEPRGMSLQDYYNNQQRLLPQMVQIVDQALQETNIGVEIIVAGKVGPECTIHTIVNPGVDSNNTPIGYSAIGSGAPHAIYSLIAEQYKPSLEKATVLNMVKSAKKRSEVAPGVGLQTQCRVISLKGEDNGAS